MPRKTVLLVLTLLVLACGVAPAGMPWRKNRGGEGGGLFPGTGAVPGLTQIGKVLTYKNDKFQELYGAAGNRYIEYGMENMMSCDYLLGDSDNDRLSLEIAKMENASAAAGLFHHHRGTVLKRKGRAVDVGAEGVLDVPRGSRNLYFYRGKYFVKIVYSGKDEAPDMMPVAKYVDSHLPAGRDDKPAGFDYIDVEGVTKDSISLTPGFTFNMSFLPPSVWASAPGAGSPASDLFIITKYNDREAAELFRDYTAYLKLHAKYIEEYKRDGMNFTKSIDPKQGRVVFASYKNALIIMARPDGYDKGEVIIDRVVARINETKGIAPKAGKAEKGEKGEKRERRGIFRRKKAG